MDTIVPQDSIFHKYCYSCKEYLAANDENFYKDRTRKDSFSARCKACQKAHDLLRRKRRKVPVSEGMKHCYKCSNTFPATSDFFPRDKNTKDGLHSLCKTCNNNKAQAHYKECPEYYRGYVEANRHRVNENTKKYYQSHLEEARLYRTTHLEQHRVHEINRRALKKAIPGTLTAQEIQAKLKAQKHKCYYCFGKFEKRSGKYIYHLEHTIPLSRTEHTPRHDVNHVVLACPACNLSKNDKLPVEWPQGGRLF